MADDWLQSLLAREAKLLREIAELEADVVAVRRLIARGKAQDESRERGPLSHQAYKPADAVRELFLRNAAKHWSAPEVRDAIQQLRDDGRVASKSANLLTTMHSILQRLYAEGFIDKDGLRYFLKKGSESPNTDN